MLLLKSQNEENVFYESSWKNLSNFWLTLLNVTFVLKRSLRTLKNKIVPGLKMIPKTFWSNDSIMGLKHQGCKLWYVCSGLRNFISIRVFCLIVCFFIFLKTVYYMHVFQKEELEQFLSRNVYCLDIF